MLNTLINVLFSSVALIVMLGLWALLGFAAGFVLNEIFFSDE